jgi:3-oxoacyl-[acyl-carrier protein] reductase
MDLKLNGKIALVLGSSDGLGKAVSYSLAHEGVTVILCARNEEKLKKAQADTGASHYEVCDFTQPQATTKLVQKVIKKYGRLDILVTNTGGPKKAFFKDVSAEDWQQDFQALWMSPVEAMNVCLPVMEKNNYGRILMITSIAAKEPLEGLATSNGLRAGLAGLAKTIVNEYSHANITVNLLLPGYTNTDRIKALNLSESKIKEMVPAARLGDPCELADLATFLASEKGAYITGQSIAIDGGVLRGH